MKQRLFGWTVRMALVSILGASWVAGCSSSSTSTPASGGDGGASADAATTSDAASTTDGATTSDASTATDGASGDCNTLTNVGTVVSETTNASALPAMTGGTIVDGTYVLSSAVEYAGSTADTKTHKRTLKISGTTIQIVNSDNGGPDVHATLSIAPSGNKMNETMTCPVAGAVTQGAYTATATTLAILKDGENLIETYTKQ